MSDTASLRCTMPDIVPRFQIGGKIIQYPCVLAPMAEYTHYPFRKLVASFGGCGLFLSEMTDTHRVVTQRGFHQAIYRHGAVDRPFLYQLVGADSHVMGEAVRLLDDVVDETGRGPDGFDINMGCGAHWIRRRHSGVGLMQHPQQAVAIVNECRRATNGIVTVKLRLGWSDDPKQLLEFCLLLQNEGIDAITLHPRLAKENLKKHARWDNVTMLKENLHIPVIGNGDLDSPETVAKRFAQSRCDAVMIGRAAIQQPWIFARIAGIQRNGVPLSDHLRQYIEDLKSEFTPDRALIRFKQFMVYFSRNYLFGHELLKRIRRTATIEEAFALLPPETDTLRTWS